MKYGFIGCGNMAGAIIGGILRSGMASPADVIGAEPGEARRRELSGSLGIQMTASNKEAAEAAEILFLTVKPQFLGDVIAEIRDCVNQGQVLVSIVAGKSTGWIEEHFGEEKGLRIVRLMPNTPALVGEGMTAVCGNAHATQEDLEQIRALCGAFGKAELVPERLFDAVTALSGSSPAYVFMFIEAMADAAVQCGMPRAQAYAFAAQAVKGSAAMMLETGKHPGELKDMVTSPAGTTIEAVRVLEDKGFRGAVIEAVCACEKRSKEL